MSEHTPGPWTATTNGIDHEITADDGTKYHRYFQVASVHEIVQRPNQGAANARLIAAAPDLLAALIAVVRIADRATNEFDAARAAIAKATGAEPA